MIVSAFALIATLVNEWSDDRSQPASAGIITEVGKVVSRAGFEGGLQSWKATSSATRLDQLAGGQGGTAAAARLRPPDGRGATIGMTNGPALVASSDRGQSYRARVWVRANDQAAASAGPVLLHFTERGGAGKRVGTWRRIALNDQRWHLVSSRLTARGDGHALNVSVSAKDVPSNGAIRVDSVTVRKLSSPRVPASILSGTRFGASVDNGETDWLDALHKSDDRFGRLDMVRVFDPDLPSDWSGRLGDSARPVVVSFRARPSSVLGGAYDREIRDWFNSAPTDRPIWWTYQHEPEDDIERGEYSASAYRSAWQHINALARTADNPGLHPTLILMCWTLEPGSHRSFSNYYPGSFIEVLAWDCYNHSSESTGYSSARDIFANAAQKSRQVDARFGIAEFGSRVVPGDDGSRRARWICQVARFAAEKNAAFVSYWDAKISDGNFQLRDLPSRRAWRGVVSSS